MTALELLGAFVLIIGGAIGFTNAVEWLGHRLNLGEGAVGALLAAVGTALPESLIPIVALLGGGGQEATDVAIGAIIGAPFLLGTLAMLLVVGSAHLFAGRREQGAEIIGDERADPPRSALVPGADPRRDRARRDRRPGRRPLRGRRAARDRATAVYVKRTLVGRRRRRPGRGARRRCTSTPAATTRRTRCR